MYIVSTGVCPMYCASTYNIVHTGVCRMYCASMFNIVLVSDPCTVPPCTTLPVLVSASGSGCELHTVPNCATWSVLVPPVTECVSVVYELVEDYENESYVLLMLIILE